MMAKVVVTKFRKGILKGIICGFLVHATVFTPCVIRICIRFYILIHSPEAEVHIKKSELR